MERGYCALLRLYPAQFRQQHAAQMQLALRDRRSDPRYPRSLAGRLRVIKLVVEDLMRSIPREHLQAWRSSRGADLATDLRSRRLGSGRGRRTPNLRPPDPHGRVALMQTLVQDLRFAWRTVVGRPAFSLVVIGTLAFGIGATTMIFSVLDGVVLRPFPYPDAERLVVLASQSGERPSFDPVSPFAFREWRHRNTVFEAMAASVPEQLDLVGGDTPERLQAAAVSPEFFTLLGVRPAIGRGLLPEDDSPSADEVAVISHGLWQRRWAGDPGVIGQTIVLGGSPRTVVGVMPADFLRPEAIQRRPVAVWLPLAAAALDFEDRANFDLAVLAKLKPDVSIETAREALGALSWALEDDPEGAQSQRLSISPGGEGVDVVELAGVRARLVSLKEHTVGDSSDTLTTLGGAVLFLLLIACANVANLLLARAAERGREVAVRVALGAGRRRIVRQLLTEATLIALTGGVAGAILAVLGVELFVGLNPGDLPRLGQVSVNLRVLGFAFLVSLLTGLAFGIVPALSLARGEVGAALKQGGRLGTQGLVRARFKAFMVTVETALALVLLIGAGLLINSFVRLTQVDLGFEPDDAIAMRIDARQHFAEPAMQVDFATHLVERVRRIPGVESVGLTRSLPFGGSFSMTSVAVDELRDGADDVPEWVSFHEINADYFASMRMELVAGRGFDAREELDGAGAVIVNQAFARTYWGGTEVVGRRLRSGGGPDAPWRTVVGVIADSRHLFVSWPAPAEIYVPFQGRAGSLDIHVVARVDAGVDATLVTPAMRQAVWDLDGSIPVANVFRMREVVSGSVDQPRFYAVLLGTFAAVALTLTAVGIYATVAYNVGQRTREIGIRRALGAGPRSLIVLVTRQGMLMVLVGLAIGGVGAYALSSMVSSFLYGIEATDLTTFAVVGFTLAAIGLAACVVPARHAARIDPMVALRSD